MDALHFSGGRDSLACLYLLQDRWDDLLVMWCNTGAAYDSTIELMRRIEKEVPHFLEVKSDQPKFIEMFGHPVDVVPIRVSPFGRMIHAEKGTRFVEYPLCCGHNIWMPMHEATMEAGISTVYRGQRDSDKRKSPVRDGDVVSGITYRFPIQHWTDAEVNNFLGDRLPDYYATEKTSRDCWNCTAYLGDNAERIEHLDVERRNVVRGVLAELHWALETERRHVARCLGST